MPNHRVTLAELLGLLQERGWSIGVVSPVKIVALHPRGEMRYPMPAGSPDRWGDYFIETCALDIAVNPESGQIISVWLRVKNSIQGGSNGQKIRPGSVEEQVKAIPRALKLLP